MRLAADGDEPSTSLIDEQTAVVLINHVDYRTGALRDMAGLTRRAHQAAAPWSSGTSATAPARCRSTWTRADADFAVGCTYKYLNGGPGAPAFIFAARRHHDAPRPAALRLVGHAQPFAMESGYRPAAGIRRLLCGTQPILSLRALKAALDVFDGVDLAALRAKSLALTGLFMDLVEPLCRDVRGTHHHAARPTRCAAARWRSPTSKAYAVVQALIARGVIGDFRAPDIMRFGFAPLYLRYRDVLDAATALRDVLRSGAWRDPRFAARATVTGRS